MTSTRTRIPAAGRRIQPRAAASVPPAFAARGGQAYSGASHATEETQLWSASRGSADADLRRGTRETLAARARDLSRNNGWIAGASQRLTDEAIGARYTLQARPDWRALGQSVEWSREWARQTEAQFRSWAMDPRRLCDATRRHSLSALLGLLFRQR
ncbi:MAG: phage portal protein, partial [Pseudomonadota bacterium]